MNFANGLSRGARRCLKRLLWYTRRYDRVHPSQKKLANGLNISDRQLRTYLSEIRRLGFLEVHQGGGGRSATYVLNSGLCSGVFPGCFQAEKVGASDDLAGDQSVTSENFRADEAQSRKSSISGSYRSECKGIGASSRPNYASEFLEELRPQADQLGLETSTGAPQEEWRGEELAVVVRHIEATEIKATLQLLNKLARKARYYGVSGFVIGAHIERAWRRVAHQPSNRPRKEAWILAVVENELAESCAKRRNRK